MDTLKQIIPLPIPLSLKKAPENVLHTGRAYRVRCQDLVSLNSNHGVCGDYKVTRQCAELAPVASQANTNGISECYFWDTDIQFSQLPGDLTIELKDHPTPLQDCDLGTNRLLLNKAELSGPQIVCNHNKAQLILSSRFDLSFATDRYAARLGIIDLVQASRFIVLENGDKVILLDTGDEDAPVLYLENTQDEQVVTPVAEQQPLGENQSYSVSREIGQHIPDEIAGKTVSTVTVLEQYWSYFVQRALTPDGQHTIWIPAYAPISWGWSIRVGRRTDGEWGILRRKLIMPTTGHDGFKLPTWNTNTSQCSVPGSADRSTNLSAYSSADVEK